MKDNYQSWIDVLKGIAIILVVVGHNCPLHMGHFIYSFHMPLFFLISGFLFSSKSISLYLKKSLLRLLVPYLSFLLIFSIPEIISIIKTNDTSIPLLRSYLYNRIYGGQLLTGNFGVFWFVTVLFISTNIFNLILKQERFRGSLTLSILLCTFIFILGYLCRDIKVSLPWNLGVVPMALGYIYTGYIIKNHFYQKFITLKTKYFSESIILIFSSLILLITYFIADNIFLDLKYMKFGIPFISLLFSIISSIAMAFIAYKLSKINHIKLPLSYIGGASLFIMFLHQPVKFYLLEHNNWTFHQVITVIICILFSLILYRLIYRFNFIKIFLLGKN